MNEPLSDEMGPEELAAVEALVRAAGDYVAPSDDLRPRALESVRLRRRAERRVSRTTLSAAAALAATLAASWQITVTGQTIHAASDRQQVSQILTAESQVTRGGFWTLVDAFFAVRQRRAEALGAASDPEDPDSAELEQNREQNGDGSGS